jgi:outer membrane protein assembly factor BamA
MIAIGPLFLAAAVSGQALGIGHWALEENRLHPSPPDAGRRQSAELIAEIRVHGNLVVPNDEVVKLAGIAVGDPFGPATIAEVTARLRESKQFDHVEVLKRFASITDPSRIVVVILVNEGAVRIELPDASSGPIAVVKRRGIHNLLFMPIIDGEDGYGVTYGARLAFVNVAGRTSRLSFPLTWGGLKRAGVEFDRPFTNGPLSRFSAGGAVQRQKNPAYLENDDRRRIWARAERAAGSFRVGGNLGWQHVSFAGEKDNIRSMGGDITFDTRIDPILPRNAVYAVASWEHLKFDAGGTTNRTRLEGRGYIGLIGQNVLALRVVREDPDRALPRYLKPLLGGWSTLRGFKAGSFAGDTLVAGSAELRIPLSSPLDVGKVGVSVFVDAGTAYDKGARYRDQILHSGTGASIWLTAAMFHMDVSVAHGRHADTRVNFGIGVTF